MKKIFSLVLALMLVSSMLVMPAHATDININGGTGTVPVVLSVQAATFSVTVPTNLPVNIDADGVIVVDTHGADIVNNSVAPVEIKGVTFTPANDWAFVDYANFNVANYKADDKYLGFSLNDVPTVGTATAATWTYDAADWAGDIAAGGTYNFKYDAKLPPQTTTAENTVIANVVFTLGWAD